MDVVAFADTVTQVPASQLVPTDPGWSLVSGYPRSYNRPPSDSTPALAEAVDFSDLSLFGFDINSLSGHIDGLAQQYRDAGGTLIAVTCYMRSNFDVLGISSNEYRLIVVSDPAPLVLAAWVAAILVGIFFLALVFHWQAGQDAIGHIANDLNNVFGDMLHPQKSQRNTFLILGAFGIVTTFGVWAISNSISKHEGFGPVAPPGAPPITTPGYSQTSGFGIQAGPIHTSSDSTVSSGSSSGSASAYAPPPPPSRAVARPPKARAVKRSGFGN